MSLVTICLYCPDEVEHGTVNRDHEQVTAWHHVADGTVLRIRTDGTDDHYATADYSRVVRGEVTRDTHPGLFAAFDRGALHQFDTRDMLRPPDLRKETGQ